MACLRSTTATGKDHTWETGKNEGGRCVIKRMENQEAQGLGEKLDLGSPPTPQTGVEPQSGTLQMSGLAIEPMLSNATVTSQTQLFKFRFTLINIK